MKLTKEPDRRLTEGVWSTEYDGAKFLISHWSHLPFQRAVQRLQAPYAKKAMAGRLDPKIARDIVSRAMADELVHDWRGVTAEDNATVVPFSPDDCYLMLNNDPGLRDFLSEFAMDQDNYRQEVKELAGKSSSPGSSGGIDSGPDTTS
jgi:hypothetical protein